LNWIERVQEIASLKTLTHFHKGFPCEEKECGSRFEVYKNVKENYNPMRVKMLWVKMAQIVRVPSVACFDPFFAEQSVNSRFGCAC
jgi:hypothetical protein